VQHRAPPSYDEAVRGYERNIQDKLKELKSGTFRVEIDEVAPRHLISTNASRNVIVPELNQHNAGK